MKLAQLSIVLIIGIIIGLFVRWDDEAQPKLGNTVPNKDTDVTNPFAVITNQQYQQRLEEEIDVLSNQLKILEQKLKEEQQADKPDTPDSTVIIPPAEKLTIENLLKAGVTESIAEDIVNRMSKHEYQLLELHDRAKREGYLNKSRYFKERRKLTDNAPSLKKAIGTDAYDHYLYETAQNNRVIVTTVMQDSPADQLGVQKGDIIMSYANEKVLSWRELRELTGKGTYGEYVNLNILRDGQLLNILVPRGSLGVRLGATILDPQAEYNY